MVDDASFTDIDLNSTGTTDIYDPISGSATGVYMKNGGSTAEIELQVTDGTNTATLAVPGAGNNLEFSAPINLNKSDKLMIDVTTKEGSSQNNTCVVFKDG